MDDILNYDREELLRDYETKKEKYGKIRSGMKEHTKSVLEHWIDVLGIKDCAVVGDYGEDYNSIVVGKTEHSYGNSVDLHFSMRYYDKKERSLTLNYCCFGSFRPEEKSKVDYLRVLGKIADHLTEIENDFRNYDWKTYDDLESEVYSAKCRLGHYDAAAKKIVEDKKKDEFLTKIKPGTKIIIGTRYSYTEDDKRVLTDCIRNVNSITKKNIMFTEDWGRRTKLDYVLNNLVNGSWIIKEKDSDTLVKGV